MMQSLESSVAYRTGQDIKSLGKFAHPTRYARAKTQLPLFRAGLIGRDALELRLRQALLGRRLVLLVSPAGYGKTATLSRQLERLAGECATAWVRLDGEDDLQRLLSYLIEALEPFDPPWRMAPEALVERLAQPGAVPEVVQAMQAALAATEVRHGVIALDDLHTVSDPRVDAFLRALLQGLPDNWTLAIASRTEPVLHLARLRAQREVAEFREAELSFSLQEVEQLWRETLGDDEPERARDLHARTQGWAAGVSLSLSAASHRDATQRSSQRESRRYMFDYLASEVLAQMPAELRDFLLRCSVLPELSATRCAKVSASAKTAELLEEIERRGLFVSVVAGSELTLRLHDLFREFLDERLRRLHPEAVPGLLRLAAEDEDDPERKVHMLLRASAWADAEAALMEAASGMLANRSFARLGSLVAQFPQPMQESSPALAYVVGLSGCHRLDDGAASVAMGRAAQGFERGGDFAQARAARASQAISLFFMGRFEEARSLAGSVEAGPQEFGTRALIALLKAVHALMNGPAEGPAIHLREVHQALLDGASIDVWYRCMTRLHWLHGRSGTGDSLRQVVRDAIRIAGDAHEPLRASARVLETWFHLGQGRLEEAEHGIDQLQQQSQWLGEPRSLSAPIVLLRIVCRSLRGDGESIRQMHDAYLRRVPVELSSSMLWRVLHAWFFGRIGAAVGSWDVVERVLGLLDQDRRWIGVPSFEVPARLLQARMALQQGLNDEALATLLKVAGPSAEVDRAGLHVLAQLCLGVAHLRAGDTIAAWDVLAPVVARVRDSGEVGDILMAGPVLLGELAEARWNAGTASEDAAVIRSWLARCSQLNGGSDETDAAAQPKDSPLTTRELDVLNLITRGQSNKLIARELDLSPHTVKRHVARILDRLDLASRAEAADWHRHHATDGGRHGGPAP